MNRHVAFDGKHWPSLVNPGDHGWATVYDRDDVYGMWQERVDGIMFFVFALPVKGRISAHWRYVQKYRDE